jgi:hypothetical protein
VKRDACCSPCDLPSRCSPACHGCRDHKNSKKFETAKTLAAHPSLSESAMSQRCDAGNTINSIFAWMYCHISYLMSQHWIHVGEHLFWAAKSTVGQKIKGQISRAAYFTEAFTYQHWVMGPRTGTTVSIEQVPTRANFFDRFTWKRVLRSIWDIRLPCNIRTRKPGSDSVWLPCMYNRPNAAGKSTKRGGNQVQ